MTNYATAADLHSIVTRDEIILARRANVGSKDFQDQYSDFKTSLAPMDGDELLDTFEYEWPDVLVINQSAMKAFIADTSPTAATELKLDIRGASPSIPDATS